MQDRNIIFQYGPRHSLAILLTIFIPLTILLAVQLGTLISAFWLKITDSPPGSVTFTESLGLFVFLLIFWSIIRFLTERQWFIQKHFGIPETWLNKYYIYKVVKTIQGDLFPGAFKIIEVVAFRHIGNGVYEQIHEFGNKSKKKIWKIHVFNHPIHTELEVGTFFYFLDNRIYKHHRKILKTLLYSSEESQVSCR